jgi:hypothetical protein
MKAAAAILGALAGLLIVGLGAYFAFGRKAPARSAPPPLPAQSAAADAGAPHPGAAVDVPLSKEEKLREELGAKRLPFYRFLRQNYGNLIERFSVLEEFDTLDLVVTQADERTLTALVQQAIAPSAKEYGFRRVRFYTRNGPNSVEPFTVVAESSEDGSGRWNTFMK